MSNPAKVGLWMGFAPVRLVDQKESWLQDCGGTKIGRKGDEHWSSLLVQRWSTIIFKIRRQLHCCAIRLSLATNKITSVSKPKLFHPHKSHRKFGMCAPYILSSTPSPMLSLLTTTLSHMNIIDQYITSVLDSYFLIVPG